MWDIAPQYDALLVFAEHRYYGESLPFGNDSYKDAAHLNYLSSEQALADFAVLIHELKVRTLCSPDQGFVCWDVYAQGGLGECHPVSF